MQSTETIGSSSVELRNVAEGALAQGLNSPSFFPICSQLFVSSLPPYNLASSAFQVHMAGKHDWREPLRLRI